MGVCGADLHEQAERTRPAQSSGTALPVQPRQCALRCDAVHCMKLNDWPPDTRMSCKLLSVHRSTPLDTPSLHQASLLKDR